MCPVRASSDRFLFPTPIRPANNDDHRILESNAPKRHPRTLLTAISAARRRTDRAVVPVPCQRSSSVSAFEVQPGAPGGQFSCQRIAVSQRCTCRDAIAGVAGDGDVPPARHFFNMCESVITIHEAPKPTSVAAIAPMTAAIVLLATRASAFATVVCASADGASTACGQADPRIA